MLMILPNPNPLPRTRFLLPNTILGLSFCPVINALKWAPNSSMSFWNDKTYSNHVNIHKTIPRYDVLLGRLRAQNSVILEYSHTSSYDLVY